MRVALLTNLSGGNRAIKGSGISRYSISLYNELKKNKAIEVDFVYAEAPKGMSSFENIGAVLGKDVGTFFRAMPFSFPKALEEADVIHCTNQMLALPLLFNKKLRKKCIVTVHDLIPVATNAYASRTEKIMYFFLLKALKKAAHIIADSEQTKKDIMKYVGYPEKKVSVIPLGIDKKEFYEKKRKRAQSTLLYVGSEQKRKNVESIIKALPLIKREIPSVTFVKVGQAQDNWNREKLKALAKQYGVEKNIVWREYVEDLAEEYSTATVFVFPSLYEGFGFPVLEAMACGCPVICSNKTSLPELAGDAALYCNPLNEKDIAEKIIQVLKDKELQKSLRKKGLQQAQKFTWRKSVQETMEVYRQVYGQP